MSLSDKIAIVTGGSQGIGKAITETLAVAGAHVIIANRNADKARDTVDELKGKGLSVEARSLDVSQMAEVERFIKQVASDFGKIDIIVNNAGITRDNLIMRLKEEDWDQVIDINLKGTFNMIKSTSRIMMKARQGRIINITSVVGLTGNAGQSNYAASKAGIIGLTKSLAKELSSRGITVNAVAPGYIESDMTSEISDDAKALFLTNIPLGRPGTGEDVAKAVCFLASEDSGYITGQTLNVDGGMVM
jgi:3-oxoacyl-[acyl-carrier protein] reductase